ncbi:MAG: hypothetical protein IKW06_02480 [Clostridia bacterium]|nr:hypothetical protein [Clostridia bacterium]
MNDKKIAQKINSLFNQLSDKQKNALSGLLKDEESIKKALKQVDTQKIKQVAEKMNLDGIEQVENMVENLKKNPDLIHEINPKQ